MDELFDAKECVQIHKGINEKFNSVDSKFSTYSWILGIIISFVISVTIGAYSLYNGVSNKVQQLEIDFAATKSVLTERANKFEEGQRDISNKLEKICDKLDKKDK